MRRCLPVILILLAIQFTFGQVSTPKVELGLGYSYSYARVPNSTTRVNMTSPDDDNIVLFRELHNLTAIPRPKIAKFECSNWEGGYP